MTHRASETKKACFVVILALYVVGLLIAMNLSTANAAKLSSDTVHDRK